MSQSGPPSEQAFDERYCIDSARPIEFLLQEQIEHGTPFTVLFNNGQDYFPTVLLTINKDANRLVFDCSGSPDANRRYVQSEHSTLIGRPGNIHVQFVAGRATEVTYDGKPAFSVPMPKQVMRLQRREFFRIETSRTRPLQFTVRLPDGKPFNARPRDISCGGIGLECTELPESLVSGLELGTARLLLPEESHEIFVKVEVRQINEFVAANGQMHWRVGIQFQNLSLADENRIQRYIARIERERHEHG